MFGAFKYFNVKSKTFWNEWVKDFTKDPYYFPEGLVQSPNNALFLSEILSDTSRFKSILNLEEVVRVVETS